MNELNVIKKMQGMCEESCSPDQFEAWESLKSYLMGTRKNLRRPTPRAADVCPECASENSIYINDAHEYKCSNCGTRR
jgi:hypothetical protein